MAQNVWYNIHMSFITSKINAKSWSLTMRKHNNGAKNVLTMSWIRLLWWDGLFPLLSHYSRENACSLCMNKNLHKYLVYAKLEQLYGLC